MKRWIYCLVGLVAFLSLPSFSMQVHAQEQTILKGICIDEIDVSGMTGAEAKVAVEAAVEEKMNMPITLTCVEDNTVTVTAKELGMTWENADIVDSALAAGQAGDVITRYKFRKDIERENIVYRTNYSFDKKAIRSVVEEQCKEYDIAAKDVSLKREGGAFVILEGSQGLVVDSEAAVTEIYDFISEEWNGTEAALQLPVLVEEPQGSVSQLQAVKDVLGTYSTSFATSAAARVANVENGCRLLNGVTLYPGEEFSTLELVTPFSVENGYQMAGSYLNGLVVDSLGGGICQVSTTLYNAVLRAELEVTQRHNHSMSVSYVPLSADAAIAESAGKDFRFKNNKEYPVYVEGYITPERVLTFTIYGVETRAAGRTVDYVSEVLESTPPTTENIIQNAAQPIGFTNVQAAHIGYKAKLIKVVYMNGVEQSRSNVNASNYKMVPRTLTVGTQTANPDHANRMQAAIATGNIDHVRDVAGVLAAEEKVVTIETPDI